MVQIDPPLTIGVGSLLAHAARVQLRSGRPEAYWRAFSLNLLFSAFANNWAPMFLVTQYFGFQTTHRGWRADSVLAYPLFVPVFLVVLSLGAVAGFQAGCWLERRGRSGLNRLLFIGMFAASGLWVALQPARAGRLGTYAQYQAGTAPWWSDDPRFVAAVLVAALVWFGTLIPLYRYLAREGRPAAAAPGPS